MIMLLIYDQDKYYIYFKYFMTFPRKKRGDTEIGNISGMPKKVTKKYRDDMHLKTALKKKS